jgi:hypothetical protein
MRHWNVLPKKKKKSKERYSVESSRTWSDLRGNSLPDFVRLVLADASETN